MIKGTGLFFWLKARGNKCIRSLFSDDQNFTCHCDRRRMTATVADSWQLRWWILSHGASIRVTGPTALKREIEHQLREALAGYGQPKFAT